MEIVFGLQSTRRHSRADEHANERFRSSKRASRQGPTTKEMLGYQMHEVSSTDHLLPIVLPQFSDVVPPTR